MQCLEGKPCLAVSLGAHTSDHSLVRLLGVLEEAEFYNIASLVRLVKERIRDNENRTSQVRHLELPRTRPVQAAICLSVCNVKRMPSPQGWRARLLQCGN